MKIYTFKTGRENLYWEILQFSSLRNLTRWANRNGLPKSPGRVAATITWKERRPGFLGTLILCDEHSDVETLAHEAVHMAKQFVTRLHKLRDEEELAYATGRITSQLVKIIRRK